MSTSRPRSPSSSSSSSISSENENNDTIAGDQHITSFGPTPSESLAEEYMDTDQLFGDDEDILQPHQSPRRSVAPSSSRAHTSTPPTQLVEAFEGVDTMARYRVGEQSISGKRPFLTRNMRQIFEQRAMRRRNLKASASGYPELKRTDRRWSDRVHDLARILDEESSVKKRSVDRNACKSNVIPERTTFFRSRRAKSLVVTLERIQVPTNYVPFKARLSIELSLVRYSPRCYRSYLRPLSRPTCPALTNTSQC